MSILDVEPAAARPLPVILLLDTSGSMRVADKIDILNTAVAEMVETLREADRRTGSIRLSIITFGGETANLVSSHVPIAQAHHKPLSARGRTPLGSAFKLAQHLVDDRTALPSRSYRPTIALVSDGIPTDKDWREHLEELVTSERGSKATRFALGVGAEANRDMLATFSGGTVYRADEAAQIRTFLQFVTTTVTQVTVTGVTTDAAAEGLPGDPVTITDMVWSDDDF